MCEFSEFTLNQLKRQHKALSKKVKKLQAIPAYDSLEMQRLKIEKLTIKSEIAARGGSTSGMAKEEAYLERLQVEKSAVVERTQSSSIVKNFESSVPVALTASGT
jgi:hypothetical protein